MTKKKTKKIKKKLSVLKYQYHAIAAAVVIIFVTSLTVIYYESQPKPLDPRTVRLETYFAKYDMPLVAHAQTFIDAADHYNLDWRLLPAIGVQESSGGKYMQLNNPFGWGSAEIPYNSIDDAIWDVTRHLAGHGSTTAKWYNVTSTERKLYFYNGSVRAAYIPEVMWIMEQF